MAPVSPLFTGHQVGAMGRVAHRVALAPLTRGRCSEDKVPTPLAALYYGQRSSGGLLISEGTCVSQEAMGWHCAPRDGSDQVAAWRWVTASAKAKGSVFVCLLWHLGRATLKEVTGMQPVSASPIALKGETIGLNVVRKASEVPRELTLADIERTVEDFGVAAENALRAGFDGVEIHGANGYLIDQFLQPLTNARKDQYGGSLENRLRFLTQVLDRVIEAVGAGKVGVRFSPNGAFNEMGDELNHETFEAAIKLCADRKIGYVHVMDGLAFGFHNKTKEPFTLAQARKALGASGVTLIGNCGHTKADAERLIGAGDADIIAFGRPYLSNPDLPYRLQHNLPLAPALGYPLWYTGGATGYTDQPFADERQADAKHD